MDTSESSPSVLTCRNRRGSELTDNLLRMNRYPVVFEVYKPYSILQVSDGLNLKGTKIEADSTWMNLFLEIELAHG